MGPFDHGMTRPRAVDGRDGLHVWRAAANIFNTQSRTGDKRWCLSAGKLGEGVKSPRRRISTCYEILHIGLELNGTWDVRRLYSSGSLGSSVKIVARELAKYGLDLLGQECHCASRGLHFMQKGMNTINWGQDFLSKEEHFSSYDS